MERIPPHSEQAESSALGACMLSEDALYEVLELVEASDFYNPNNKAVFKAIKALHDKNSAVDVLTVCEELKTRGDLERVGGRAYVATLSSSVPSTANAGEYADLIAKKSEMRQLIKVSEDISNQAYSEELEPSRILDSAEQNIMDIGKKRQSQGVAELKDIIVDNLRAISERGKTKGKLTGVPSGFVDLDNMTNGFQKSDMIILAARPSMGKTAFALCVARNAAAKGHKVMIFSLEMSKEQLSQRLIAMESGVDAQKLRTGELEDSDWNKISIGTDALRNYDITVDDTPGLSGMEIKNKCRKMKMEKGIDMIIIDYLQLMNSDGKAQSREQEVSKLSRNLKQLAREMECPVIVLSQLSRAPEQRTDHRPIASDLRESGSIEQDADVILFLYRDEVYNDETETPGECEVHVAKQRNGPTGVKNVLWQGKYTKFVNKAVDRGNF